MNSNLKYSVSGGTLKRSRKELDALSNSSQHSMHPDLLKNRQHLLYSTGHHSTLPEISQPLVDLVLSYLEEYGIGSQEIDVLPRNFITTHALAAFTASCELSGLNPEETDIVFCEQALCHVDKMFKGNLFLSAVLSTGAASSYVVGCISEPIGRMNKTSSTFDTQPIQTKLRLTIGDVFLLNPQHIHYASPAECVEGSLLILLQERLPDFTEEQRQATYAKYPPKTPLSI